MSSEKTKVNIGNNQQEKIVTKELKISDNILIFDKTLIPLQNISRASVADAPKQLYQWYQFAMILVGILALFTKRSWYILVGLVFIALGVYLVYKTKKYNDDRGEYIILCLNSGEKIYLHSTNHEFSIRIIDVIANCINADKFQDITNTSNYNNTQDVKVLNVFNMETCSMETCTFNEYNENIFER